MRRLSHPSPVLASVSTRERHVEQSPALGRVCPDITSLMFRRAACSDQQEMG